MGAIKADFPVTKLKALLPPSAAKIGAISRRSPSSSNVLPAGRELPASEEGSPIYQSP